MDPDSEVEAARRRLGVPEKSSSRKPYRRPPALVIKKKREDRKALKAMRSEIVTEVDALRYKLAKFDPDLPAALDAYVKAIKARDISALDLERAQAFATKALIRKQAVADILERGVTVSEEQLDDRGRVIATRVKANPLLEPLHKLDDQLGYTAEQERLTRRSQGQGARDDAITAALQRDARLRAANKALLPEPDEEILRDGAIDVEAKSANGSG